MGRDRPGHYGVAWTPPTYTVDEDGKVRGGYQPPGPHNWGRWGDDDVRGTTNLLTPERVAAAAGLVRSGTVVSLALPIDDAAPRWPERAPAKHYFTMSGSDAITGSPANVGLPERVYLDDAIDINTQSSTQWDGLAHFSADDSIYNGYWVGNITALGGADRNGIHHQANTLVGRGVLLDVAAHKGVDSLEPGEVISPSLLDDVAEAQGVEVRAGDMLLIRTGYLSRWWNLTEHAQKMEYFYAVPGIGHEAVEWIARKDLAALAADTVSVEVLPKEDDSPRFLPIHHAALVDLGLTLGEFWDLEKLSVVCREQGQYEFLLVAPPLHIVGAVGSPINPVAIL